MIEVLDESRGGFRQLAQQGAVIRSLVGMRIESADAPAAHFREIDPDAQAGANKLGDRSQVLRQGKGRVSC